MTLQSKTLVALMTTTVLGFATTAAAQDGWSGEASLAGSRTTGNTETTDIGVAFNVQKETDLWRHTARGSADFGRVSGEDNKRRFTLGYQLDRDLNDRLYVFGNADYFNDEFGSFNNGIFLGGGLGYKVILPSPVEWDLEGGVGYRSQSPQRPDVPGDVTQEEFDLLNVDGDFDRTNEVALRGASKFKYDLNDNVNLYNNSEIIWSSSDTYLWNEIGITANLVGNLAARASYRVDYHSDVLDGIENTDTITRFGVVYTLN